jgi:acid stress-induced BolA-like protein IbaG/YrbA
MIHNGIGARFGTLRAFSCKRQHFLEMEPEEIKSLIENGLAGATAEVFSEDNTHYAALVISAEFEGKRPIARHQLVYRCLGSLMGNEIHAMSIRAHTPEEWAELQGPDSD